MCGCANMQMCKCRKWTVRAHKPGSKAGKGLTEKRAGESGLQQGSFFLSFLYQDKKD